MDGDDDEEDEVEGEDKVPLFLTKHSVFKNTFDRGTDVFDLVNNFYFVVSSYFDDPNLHLPKTQIQCTHTYKYILSIKYLRTDRNLLRESWTVYDYFRIVFELKVLQYLRLSTFLGITNSIFHIHIFLK